MEPIRLRGSCTVTSGLGPSGNWRQLNTNTSNLPAGTCGESARAQGASWASTRVQVTTRGLSSAYSGNVSTTLSLDPLTRIFE